MAIVLVATGSGCRVFSDDIEGEIELAGRIVCCLRMIFEAVVSPLLTRRKSAPERQRRVVASCNDRRGIGSDCIR